MKRAVGWLVSLVLLAAVVIGGLGWLQPDRLQIRHSVDIAAAPEQVLPFVEDFTQWVKWSPWEHVDPDLKRQFGNPFRGMGASYAWIGNDRAGEQRLRMRTARLPNGVHIDVESTRPWVAAGRFHFAIEPAPGGSRVTWAIDQPIPFAARVRNVFDDRPRRIDADVVAGLDGLKRVVETETRPKGDAPDADSPRDPTDSPKDPTATPK